MILLLIIVLLLVALFFSRGMFPARSALIALIVVLVLLWAFGILR